MLRDLKFSLDHKLTLPPIPASFLGCSWTDVSDTFNDSHLLSTAPPLSISPVKLAEVESAVLLTSGTDVKHKIELFLSTKDFDIDYSPGDTVGLFPVNPVSEVDELISALDLTEEASKIIKIEVLKNCTKKNSSVPKHIPLATSLKDLLSKHLEIRSPIKKLFLRSLCNCTENEREKRRLEELCSKEGSDDYNKLLSDNITLLSLLKEFKSCKPPINTLLEHLPPIKPRIYSIASSPINGKTTSSIRLVVTIVENDSGLNGVCSGYLNGFVSATSSLESKFEALNLSGKLETERELPKVQMFFRQSNSFHYPEDPSINHIMIGAGSGVAPFIGFLEHKKQINLDSPPVSWLFFGCRSHDDYIYREKLEGFLSSGILTRLFVSFSRLSKDNSTPKYVQDNILSVKKEFINLLNDDKTRLYICGDARNMVKDVLSIVTACMQERADIDESEADSKIKEMCRSGKIITDSWI